MPFRAPGSGLPRLHGFATIVPVIDAFAPSESLAKPDGFGPRPRAPLPPGARFSEPRRRPLTSATEFDARTHPTSRRSSHASKAFTPLHAGTRTVPVALASWCVAAPGACEPRSAPRRLSPPRSTCVDGAVHGPELSSKGVRALLTICACPPRGDPGTRVAGSTHRQAWTTWRFLAPAETLRGCNLAKGHTFE